MSLCWHNLEPREDSRAKESERVEGAEGERAEARRTRPWLLIRFQSLVAGFSAPIPARNSMQRMTVFK